MDMLFNHGARGGLIKIKYFTHYQDQNWVKFIAVALVSMQIYFLKL